MQAFSYEHFGTLNSQEIAHVQLEHSYKHDRCVVGVGGVVGGGGVGGEDCGDRLHCATHCFILYGYPQTAYLKRIL